MNSLKTPRRVSILAEIGGVTGAQKSLINGPQGSERNGLLALLHGHRIEVANSIPGNGAKILDESNPNIKLELVQCGMKDIAVEGRFANVDLTVVMNLNRSTLVGALLVKAFELNIPIFIVEYGSVDIAKMQKFLDEGMTMQGTFPEIAYFACYGSMLAVADALDRYLSECGEEE